MSFDKLQSEVEVGGTLLLRLPQPTPAQLLTLPSGRHPRWGRPLRLPLTLLLVLWWATAGSELCWGFWAGRGPC